MHAGQTIGFVLSYCPSYLSLPESIDVRAALAATARFWRRWIGRSSGAGEYTGTVRRSLITLKALTYRPSAGILAAATTSLPEAIGGVRNWDYRYCWLRDATFTLQAMMNERLLALRNDVGLLSENSIRAPGGCSATFRSRSRTSRSSTLRTT